VQVSSQVQTNPTPRYPFVILAINGMWISSGIGSVSWLLALVDGLKI
jgi:hypothetical protein